MEAQETAHEARLPFGSRLGVVGLERLSINIDPAEFFKRTFGKSQLLLLLARL